MDFSKWAIVSYKDDTGLGRLAADLRSVLAIGYHLVVPSQRLAGHPLSRADEIPLDPEYSDEQVKVALAGKQGIIVLERSFHLRLFPLAKELGLKTVLIPMWEWFLGTQDTWKWCDLFVCPSQQAMKIVHQFGFRNTVHIPIALDLERFAARQISGPARVFIHNAGLVDNDDRKGTRDTILGFRRVRRRDVSLIVRLQRETKLPEIDARVQVLVGNLPDPAALYASGDVAIQPSKLEGAGMTVLEPLCTGMPVITLDYPPMNEYVLSKELLVRKRWFKRKAFATNWVPHAHLRLPDIDDIARKIKWCADNDMSAISSSNRQFAETTFSKQSLNDSWHKALSQL